MVSSFKYRSFKKITLWRRKPFGVFLAAVLGLYIFALIPEVALFGAFLAYAFSGPVEWSVLQVRARREAVAGLSD
jgi:CDP-diacylglycerol--serine O-phosphatidyltransferase